MVKKLFSATLVLFEPVMDNDNDDYGTHISYYCDDKGSKDLYLEVSSTFRNGDENIDLSFTLPEGLTNRSKAKALIAPNSLGQGVPFRKY